MWKWIGIHSEFYIRNAINCAELRSRPLSVSALLFPSFSPHLLKISIFKCAQRKQCTTTARTKNRLNTEFMYLCVWICLFCVCNKCSFEYALNEHACNPVFGEMYVPFDREILQHFFLLWILNFSIFQIYAAKRLDLHKKSKQTFAANLNLMEPKNICFYIGLFFFDYA